MRNIFFAALLTCGLAAFAQQQGQGDREHHQAVNQRGDQVMGFSHDKTKHHFRLDSDGGAIEVETINPNDPANRLRRRLAATMPPTPPPRITMVIPVIISLERFPMRASLSCLRARVLPRASTLS